MKEWFDTLDTLADWYENTTNIDRTHAMMWQKNKM